MHSSGGRARSEPAIGSRPVRVATGTALVAASSFLVASIDQVPFRMVVVPSLIGWAVSTWLTDKYRHKYPQRYYSYLLASHGKAAAIMGVILVLFGLLAPFKPGVATTFHAAILVVAVDFLLSVPRTRMKEEAGGQVSPGVDARPTAVHPAPLVSVNTSEIVRILTEAPDVASFGDLLP